MPSPQQPNTFPWSGKIVPWSAALRNKPALDARTLADLPRGENVKVVLRSGGWLYVECRPDSQKPLKGYVSRELIKHVQPSKTSGGGAKKDNKADVTPKHTGKQSQQKRSPIQKASVEFRLTQPKIIAIATDTYLTPMTKVADSQLPGSHVLDFGQDISFSMGRKQPTGVSIGKTPAVLSGKMRLLLGAFASNDASGKAKRLFEDFLKPQRSVLFWSDMGLTAAAKAHPNITTFVYRALSAPNSPVPANGKTRIHQALEKAGWDINAVQPVTGLGVPAFNLGSTAFGTGDFGNGLGVMINGVQHAIVVAKEYYFNRAKNAYYIKLEYVFYDVFGLDDDDLKEYGADGGWFDSAASQGITAWWQLQHQHGYAPLITRIAFEQEFTVPTRKAGP